LAHEQTKPDAALPKAHIAKGCPTLRKFLSAAALLAGAAFLNTPAQAQVTARDPLPTAVPAASVERPAPPKLIIAISVDQFSADLFSEYRSIYTGGLARLAGGVVFPQGYQSHGATETCPGHSTILTGSYPGRTGIIANNWYDLSLAREDKRVYCSEDPSVAGTSSAGGRYAPSINFLLVPTLGDRMRAVDPRTQVVSVAGKDRAAIMMGGRAAQEMWWLSPTGLSSYRGVEQSPVVARISTAIVGSLAQPRPAMALPTQCAGRDIAIDIGGGRTVGTGRFAREAGNMRGFMASPEADGAVLAAAATLRAERHLGEGPTTDLLILGLSATDYVGHTYGTGGSEMCLQMLALDQSLGDFFTRMDATGIDYAVVLTADHGGHDLPERNRQLAAPSAQRVDAALAPEAIGRRLATELHITTTGPLISGDGAFGDMYVNRTLSAAQRTRVIAAATRMLSAHPQVERVILGSTLAAMPMPTRSPELWTLEERLRASYNAQRSGDFLLVLKPRVTPIPETNMGYVATHGSVWDYDRRVPILFWRAGMHHFEQPNPVMTVDILPSLAGMIGLPIAPGQIDGRCLDLLSGTGTSCPAQ
jgi:predicted AlkP superfamily pyrophosphatase or phosphodiesterase